MVVGILLMAALVIGDGESPKAALAAADDAFVRMDYPTAIATYEEMLQSNPGDTSILWRLARAYVCVAEPLEDGRRPDLCRKAEAYARKCIALDPSVAEGHTWLAGALGYLALDTSMKHQAGLSKEILGETEKALAINPRDDAALSIRGSLFRALGNVSWVERRLAGILFGGIPDGGFKEAEESLQRAVAIAPDVMRHEYELGVLYIDMGRIQDARAALEKVLTLPVRVAIDKPRLLKAKALLQTLENK
ncbi:MAG TPA: tetratricopeptide repeat protein [Bacteroidota bacterium]|nr:tetratricopeptide repeat protein [Bacteroidota bacterium]